MIGLIRHGITKWNKEGRIQGGIDVPLDEEGVKMAQKVASRLSKEQWDVIYTSPLQRAKKTAQLIAMKQSQLEVLVDDRLREIGEGEKEGTTEIERLRRWGEQWRDLALNSEEDQLVVDRIMSFIEELRVNRLHQKVLVVSHGSLIERIIKILCPTTHLQKEIDNASLTMIVLGNPNNCILKNCVKHLQ